jgi:hypothetical protein
MASIPENRHQLQRHVNGLPESRIHGFYFPKRCQFSLERRKIISNSVFCILIEAFKIFDNAKPLILKDAYVKIRSAIDENLLNALGDNQVPNSISPIDFAIAECRKLVRAKK